MFPATLFDYNGVLVDDEAVHLAAFQEVLAPLGIELTEKDYWERYLGFDDAGAFAAIFRDHDRPLDESQVAALIEQKRPVYLSRARTALRGFPGAADVLRRRAACGPVVIVSGALRDEIELGLDFLGVRGEVKGIVAAEDAKKSKPDPQGYLMGIALLEELASRDVASRALVIEDSVAGVQAAKAARLSCVAVTHSYGEHELRAAGADLVVRDIAGVTEELLSTLYRRNHG